MKNDMNDTEKFDSLFRNSFEGFEPEPPAEVWTQVEQLSSKGAVAAKTLGVSMMMKSLAIILPLAALSWWVLSPSSDQPNSPEQQLNTPVSSKEIMLADTVSAKESDGPGQEPLNRQAEPQLPSKVQTAENKQVKKPAQLQKVETKNTNAPLQVSNTGAPANNNPVYTGNNASSLKPAAQQKQNGPEEVRPLFVPAKTRVCVGEQVLFQHKSAPVFDHFRWDFDDDSYLNQQQGADAAHIFEAEGTYQVTLTGYRNAKPYHYTIRIQVIKVSAYFTVDCNEAPLIRFQNQSKDAVNYQWDFGDNLASSNLSNPVHRFENLSENDRAAVRLVARQDACADTFLYEFKPLASTKEMQPFVPNVFTPGNDDEMNSRLVLNIENENYIHLVVMDRSGRKVFEATNKEEQWDGMNRFTGKECPSGDYFYLLKYKLDGNSAVKTQTGLIKLIR